MSTAKLKDLIGKEVIIYPGDTYKKRGIVKEVSDHGILFKITFSKCPNYKVDSLHFIGIGSQLSFATL